MLAGVSIDPDTWALEGFVRPPKAKPVIAPRTDSVFVEHAQACLKRLESDAFREQLKDLRAQVKSAEREGRLEEAIRLMAELNRREREARAGA